MQKFAKIGNIAQKIAKNQKMRRNPQNSQQKSENCAGICKKTENAQEFAKFAQITKKLRRNFQKSEKTQWFTKFANDHENCAGNCKK